MRTLLTIGLILAGELTFGQYPVVGIILTLIDNTEGKTIIADTSSAFKITFRQEVDTITINGKQWTQGINQICQDTDYRNGVRLNGIASLRYFQDNGQYLGGTWRLSIERPNDVPFDFVQGLYIIEITDTRNNRTMELLFRPQSIGCEKATIFHGQGRYYICAPDF